MLVYALNVLNENDLVRELKALSCDPQGIKIMREKLNRFTIKLTDLPAHIALIIKESALSCGADFALPRGAIMNKGDFFDGLLLINKQQLRKLTAKLAAQSFRQLRDISLNLKAFLKEPRFKIPAILGILNITPDSFSDGGNFLTLDTALLQAKKMIKAGAKIIDVGGESTRPGAAEISCAEELARVIPVIKALHSANPNIAISIDTTKSKVAESAVKNGAAIINDISGLTRDEKIAKVAAKYKTKLILMHRLAPSKTMQNNPQYQDILKEILIFLKNSIEKAIASGVKKENIIVDPGIGFGKTTAHNLYLLKHLCAFRSLGCPLLLGASRKSVIGNILKNDPPQRTAGTIATSLSALLNNVDYLRVHDITENLDALKVFQKIIAS